MTAVRYHRGLLVTLLLAVAWTSGRADLADIVENAEVAKEVSDELEGVKAVQWEEEDKRQYPAGAPIGLYGKRQWYTGKRDASDLHDAAALLANSGDEVKRQFYTGKRQWYTGKRSGEVEPEDEMKRQWYTGKRQWYTGKRDDSEDEKRQWYTGKRQWYTGKRSGEFVPEIDAADAAKRQWYTGKRQWYTGKRDNDDQKRQWYTGKRQWYTGRR